jgi:hypothetical protein
MARLSAVVDFLVRAAFFALAPFLVVFVAMLFPVTGAVVQIAAALAVFFAGEAVRRYSLRVPLLAKLLANELKFESYYREHPPRPFLYYVAYPLLFPYWLINTDARREFLLFKGYTLFSFGVMLVSLGVQYRLAFPPELTLHDFAPIAGGTLLAETAVVLLFLMPVVTTVVHFHRGRSAKRLLILLAIGLISIGFAAARLERRRDPIVSFATRTRVRLRTARAPQRAIAAQTKALRAAWQALPREKRREDIDDDGKVEGPPLETARQTLVGFYKNDEAHAFDLWYTRSHKHAILVLFFEAERSHAPIWLAIDHTQKTTHDVAQLPAGAFKAMRHASH